MRSTRPVLHPRSQDGPEQTLTYHATKKHAVISTSNGWSFGYDANGNMNSYKGNSIAWTSYNLPSTINGAGQSSQFAYGPNRNRWRQIASYPSGSETTIYVGGILEKVTVPTGTGYRHYVGAGSARVVYTRWSSGLESTRYVTTDHLNSSTVVMDNAGASLVNLSFAAFGARRGAAWSGTPSTGDWTQINNATRHGYTGHEHLDNINIIHMNGRVYDPALGRFLSADQVIRDVGASQSWSGYGYAEGHVISWTDPTGWAPKQGFTLSLPKMGALTVGEIMNQINEIAGTDAYLAMYAHLALGLNTSPQVRGLANQVVGPSASGATGSGTVGAVAAGAQGTGGQGQGSTTGTVSTSYGNAQVVGTLLEDIIVSNTRIQDPDLGRVGNQIRGMLETSFQRFLFERYWLGQGDRYQLTQQEFDRAVAIASQLHPFSTNTVTTKNGIVLTWNQYAFTDEYAWAFGSASVFFDQTGVPVGFYDNYNFNFTWDSSFGRQFIAGSVQAGCFGQCVPFDIIYGQYVNPNR